jgi:transcriptional regulator with XRE-family HTH domain
MSARFEYRQIAAALRKVLKARGLTYEELAAKVGVSERTVKRIIHGDDYSLTKLAEVCEAIGVKFFDLMRLAEDEAEETFQLTLEQEELLAANLKHLKFFWDLVDGRSVAWIKKRYGLTDRQFRGYLKDLEEFGLIERLSGDEVRLKVVGRAHTLLSGGPLNRVIGAEDLRRFTEHILARQPGTHSFSTSSGTQLSKKSIDEFIKEGEALAAKFRLVSQRECSVLPETELVKVRWLVGIAHPFVGWAESFEI